MLEFLAFMCILAVSCLDSWRKSVAQDFPCIRPGASCSGSSVAGEMMDNAAETFSRAGCDQAGESEPPSVRWPCLQMWLCTQDWSVVLRLALQVTKGMKKGWLLI